MKLKGKELFKLSNDNETHYFTSLHRIGQFVGTQRAQVEYCALKGKTIKGWTIDIVDGSKVMWENIDEVAVEV